MLHLVLFIAVYS